MTTITLDADFSDYKHSVEALLEETAIYDCNWSGAEFSLELGDFTGIDTDDEISGAALLASINNRIDSHREIVRSLEECDADDVCDALQGEAGQAFVFDGGSMVFDSSSSRAGLAWNADAEWTDASSPRDALLRFLAGRMDQ